MTALEGDSQLERAMQVEGYKVLPPCVLYGKIGQGGMGAVYRGRHLNLDIDVAVKCLKPGLVESDDQFVVRFRREARAAAQINHQNVIRVFDVAEEKGLHYIVMELVQGETARERLLRKKRLTVGEALEIVYRAATGLGEAHRRGFIHRDIKPDNIMISSSGQVKVADLGLAKPAMRDDQASMLSGTNLVMGTPQYMPPEQWENTSTVTTAADVWALGATLYYLLAGTEAFAKDSLPRIMQKIVLQPFPDVREVRPDVPSDVAALIAVATQQLPGARYQDAQDMADAIEQLETRRLSLQDRDAAPTTQQNTLLSPPPAKTLARIKFWLDGQAARTEGRADVDKPGTLGTQGMQPPEAKAKSSRRWSLWLGAAVVTALVALLLWLQPWAGAADPFRSVNDLEAAEKYAEAIVAAERIHAADPSLPGRLDRLARLRAANARLLALQERFREAVAEIDASLLARDSASVREQRAALVRQITQRVDQALVREAPAAVPVRRQGPVAFRGRLVTDLATGVTIGGESAALAADGRFAVEIDTRGLGQIEVQVRLFDAETVELRPWVVVYEQTPLVTVMLDVAPKELELDDDREATLTIRLPREAELRLDGARVERSGTEEIYLHRVRSDQIEPDAIEVVGVRPGFLDSRIVVPVKRRVRALSFVRPPQFVGVRKLDDQRFATGKETVQVQGELNERADVLLVNGTALADLQWRDNAGFTGSVTLREGRNELRLEAQRRFRQATLRVLQITRLAAPVIAVREPPAGSAGSERATQALVVEADEGTVRVTARCGTNAPVILTRDGMLFRGQVSLGAGANVIRIEAFNVVDDKTEVELTVQRLGAATAPTIDAVTVVLAARTIEVVRGGVTYLQELGTLRFASSDPAATVTINGQEAGRTSEPLAVDLTSLLKEGEGAFLELRLQNAMGRSEPFRVKLVYDRTGPVVEVAAPSAPVARGQVFELRGRWVDPAGLKSVAVGDLAGTIRPGGGDAKAGEWVVRMPAIDAAIDVTVVIVDRAGNPTQLTVRIEVR